jgi:peptidoglycan-associated lipoprotein
MATDIANRARADSIERVRVAEGLASREGAATSSRLRTELSDAVNFEVAADRIDSDGGASLDRKVAILKANPTIRLQITGACDERGSEAYNQRLGDRRAASVKEYLIARGIDAGRLDARSAGEGTPIDHGSNEAAWAKNRRADFVIVSGAARLSMNE